MTRDIQNKKKLARNKANKTNESKSKKAVPASQPAMDVPGELQHPSLYINRELSLLEFNSATAVDGVQVRINSDHQSSCTRLVR